ncbi:MAG: glycosyl transferase [Acidimicrobiaceae bacterium]|nr:glycosyl transferase [Acidimicrobiaceae bacterium]
MSVEPLVSVVVPVLNGERHLTECLGSVLGQSYENLEVVVADNASSDDTGDVIRSFADRRVRILPMPVEPVSLHDNWSRGLDAATGDLVKIVCHDDVLTPDCVAVQVDLLQRHPSAVLASARRRIIDDQGGVLIRARGLGSLPKPTGTRLIGGAELARACTRAGANLLGEPAGVLIRRSALPAPLFDSRWHYTIDVEFYMRSVGLANAVVDSRVLCSFRVSPHQLSASLASEQAAELKRFFAELARRYPDQVSRRDVRLGTARARLLAEARRALYQQMRVRALVARSRGRSSPTERRSTGVNDVTEELP